jgi:hypothetical protein
MKVFQQPPAMLDVPVSPVVAHGDKLVVVDETIGGEVTVGIAGIGPTAVTVGNTLIVGTAAGELTPRLPISMEPNGIPVRAAPPGVVGDVGVDDAAMLLEPEPHIPDMPEVCSIPDVVDIPDDGDIPDVAIVPDVAAVAGAAVPIAIPPPSKLAVDPNIDDGAVPMVEHVVLLPDMEIVPVASPGAGLTPGDAISVEPRGMPVGETAELVPKPSGEVAPRVGVGLASPLTCAMATLQTSIVGKTAAISENLTGTLRFAAISPGASYRASVNPVLLAQRGRLARPVQLNTHLLSQPGIQLRDLKRSRGCLWKLKISLIEQASFAHDVHG